MFLNDFLDWRNFCHHNVKQMLYTIVDKSEVQKCLSMGMCDCMCDKKILKWNNDNTKALLYIYKECKCCNIQNSIYTENYISTLLKNDKEWMNKSIV